MSSIRLRRPLAQPTPSLRLAEQDGENVQLVTGKAGLSVSSSSCPTSVKRRALVDTNRRDAAPGKVSVGSGKGRGDVGGGGGVGGDGDGGGGGGGAIIGKVVTAAAGAVDGASASRARSHVDAKPRVEPLPPAAFAEEDFPDIETMIAWSPLGTLYLRG
ncbi:uncharacterized protein LOC116937562 [Petromyzon marinus]|uniref:uncharacterized protein LOC116937562 n=1 Tax=Petromyzon marinus TaxID=7757 RepID=UPI003F6EB0F6